MTPHIEAKKEEIKKTVLMPGDPLRAKYIAEKYLENPVLVNKIRNIFAYTGTYKGKDVTVMASGMGMPSIGIYAYELYNSYDVETIIRIGTCGAYSRDIKLYDVFLVNESFTDSNFAYVYDKTNINIARSDTSLNNKIKEKAINLNIDLKEGKVHSSDVFYSKSDTTSLYNTHSCFGAEMESFALLFLAAKLNKKATCLLTISNNIVTHEETTPKEREQAFDDMIVLALESI